MKTFGIAIPVYKATNTINNVLESCLEITENIVLFVDDNLNYDFSKTKYPFLQIIYNKENLGYQKNWNKCLEWLEQFEFGMIVHSDDVIDGKKILNTFLTNKINKWGILGFNIWQKENLKHYFDLEDFTLQTGLYLDCSSLIYNFKEINGLRYRENLLACDEFFFVDLFEKKTSSILVVKSQVLNRRLNLQQTEYFDLINKPLEVVKANEKQLVFFNKKPNLQKFFKIKILRTVIRGALLQILIKKQIPSKVYFNEIIKYFPILFTRKFIRTLPGDTKRLFNLVAEC